VKPPVSIHNPPALRLTVSFLLLLFSLSFPATRDISDLAVSSGKYLLVSEQLSVSEGDTLLVASGLNVLFAPLTGITVSGGTFIVNGTKDMPVYLTSLNDTSGAATPFDWNGIEISSGGSARLSFCYIAYASSGITAPDSAAVTIEQCIFSNNGQWHLNLAGNILPVPELQPYDYSVATRPPLPAPPSSAQLSDTGVGESQSSLSSLETLSHPSGPPSRRSRSKLVHTIVFSTVGIALVGGGIYSLQRGYAAKGEYDAYLPGNAAFDAATPSQRDARFDHLRSEATRYRALGWLSIGFAAADAVFLTWRVAF